MGDGLLLNYFLLKEQDPVNEEDPQPTSNTKPYLRHPREVLFSQSFILLREHNGRLDAEVSRDEVHRGSF